MSKNTNGKQHEIRPQDEFLEFGKKMIPLTMLTTASIALIILFATLEGDRPATADRGMISVALGLSISAWLLTWNYRKPGILFQAIIMLASPTACVLTGAALSTTWIIMAIQLILLGVIYKTDPALQRDQGQVDDQQSRQHREQGR